MIKEILGIHWKIKSVQSFGLMIERVDNPADVRRISHKGWDQATEVPTKS